jgi:two-component system, NarL family, sensor histidine kinase UhpB
MKGPSGPAWDECERAFGIRPCAELDMMRERLRAVIDLSPVAIWIADDGRISFANRAAARLVGVADGDALVGTSPQTWLDPDHHAALAQRLERARRQERVDEPLAATLRRADGRLLEVEIGIGALPDHGHAVVQMVIADASTRRQQLREVEASRRALRRLSANVVEAREEERRRIARELHDELGQGLSALKMEIAGCARAYNLDAADARISEMLAHLDEITASVRRIAADLRPLMLDDLGLDDAIEALAQDFRRRHGIAVELALDPMGTPADPRIAIGLYRMVQESLTNVARHAQATRVRIGLRRVGDSVELEVADNGVGATAPPSPRDSQFGLLGMRERADMLGGSFAFGQGDDGGARVRVHVPWRDADAPAGSAR